MSSGDLKFTRERHIRYFSYCLRTLPTGYDKLDTNRLTLVHFCVQALDVLGCLDSGLINKQAIIEWVDLLLVENGSGYLGGTFLGPPTTDNNRKYRDPHVAMTYTALCIQCALSDGEMPSFINKKAITEHLRSLQQPDGSFACVAQGSEQDMRFLYCACCISHMLNDWSGVDKRKAVEFIRSCRSFDGAVALIPGQEGHGGSTFTAVASLILMGELDNVFSIDGWRKDLIRWCVSRQLGGMQGRPNKLEDTCYSYWIGGTLLLLGQADLLDGDSLREYVLTCQSSMGGFGKVVGAFPDVLHSFYSLAWLSLSDEDDEFDLRQLNCTLGICQERADMFGGVLP